MKSFLEWFKSSAKVKRWMFLIILGMALACFGFSKILVAQEMSVLELIEVIATFVIGFICVVVGIVFIQKRNLEILIEANDTTSEVSEKAKINIKSLIFNKKVYDEGPKIVVIGGGEGLDTVIRGLKKYTNNITAIVTMSEYGNIPTSSRKELAAMPLGDIKSSLIAMSDKEEMMSKLMNLEFQNKRLAGLNFGDIYLTAMNELYSNISEAIEKSTEILNIKGKVLPVTLDEITICAELNDGTIVESKDKIPQVVSQKVEKINRIFINPSNCSPAPGVISSIEEAEAIIIGPGSLYTNVLPNLLVKRVAKTIKESKAVKIYISNIMTEFGQTDSYTLAEHIKTIQDHVGTDVFEYCLADTGEVIPEFVRKYNKEGSEIVEADVSQASSLGVKIIQRDMSCVKGDRIRHNSDIIASTVVELICDELRFKDMQNETEYLLLNSNLKETKKNIAKFQNDKKTSRNQAAKSVTRNRKKGSRFSEKYKSRMESIKNSERIEEINKAKMEKKLEKKKKSKEAEKKKAKKAETKVENRIEKKLEGNTKNTKAKKIK